MIIFAHFLGCFIFLVKICFLDSELVYSTAEFTDSHIFEPDEFLYEIMVNVTNDMIVEATEDHMIFLRVPEGETGVNLPQDSVTITVEDDEDCKIMIIV